jgi:hypothetical protein
VALDQVLTHLGDSLLVLHRDQRTVDLVLDEARTPDL